MIKIYRTCPYFCCGNSGNFLLADTVLSTRLWPLMSQEYSSKRSEMQTSFLGLGTVSKFVVIARNLSSPVNLLTNKRIHFNHKFTKWYKIFEGFSLWYKIRGVLRILTKITFSLLSNAKFTENERKCTRNNSDTAKTVQGR